MARKIKQAQSPEQAASQIPLPKYDPKKQWQWRPDAKFEFTGIEFHRINSALSEFIASDLSVPTILRLAEAFTVMQAKMGEYVEKGTITEMPVEA